MPSFFSNSKTTDLRRFVQSAACITVFALGLSGCTDAPDLSAYDREETANAPWPTLLPTDQIAGLTQPNTAIQRASAQSDTQALARRAQNLRARAASLRSTPVLSQAERRALLAAIARKDQ